MKPQVICLPGSVAPAVDRYRPLVAAVGEHADLHLKELEVYAGDVPPADYQVEQELTAVDQYASSRGLDRFHLVGYSGGGYLSLAYVGTRPDRILSLALFEAARVPGELTSAERDFFNHLNSKLAGLQGPDFMATFAREQVKPGATLPPPAPPNTETRKRPAGVAGQSLSRCAGAQSRRACSAVSGHSCPTIRGDPPLGSS